MDAPYSSTDKFPRVPLKIAGAKKPLQFSHNKKLMDAPSQNFGPAHGCPLWMPPDYGGS